MINSHVNGIWKAESLPEDHEGWVRDVAWSPNIGLPANTIASCSQVYFQYFSPRLKF